MDETVTPLDEETAEHAEQLVPGRPTEQALFAEEHVLNAVLGLASCAAIACVRACVRFPPGPGPATRQAGGWPKPKP